MAGMRFPPLRLPTGVPLWATLCGLLAVGIATTLLDLRAAPLAEQARANAASQRAIIDPATGTVSLGVAPAGASETFDVAEPSVPAAEPPVPSASEATPTPTEPTAPADANAGGEAIAASETGGGALPAGLDALRTEAEPVTNPIITRTRESLVIAPAREITETVDGLTLPKRLQSGASPSRLYAHPFNRTAEQHLVTFLITDVGLDAHSLPLILGLPREVSVALSPYTRTPKATIETLRNGGFEVWTMLPSMGERYPQDDPGPLGLISSLPKEELLRRLRQIMNDIIGSVGFVLPPDESMSDNSKAFTSVLTEITQRGLLVASTHPTHSLEQLSRDKTLQENIRRADIRLDPEPNTQAIEAKLASIPALAQEKETLVVTLSARPHTLRLLSAWLEKNTFAAPAMLAPMSAHYQPKEPPPAPEAPAEGGGHGGGDAKKAAKVETKPVKPLPQDKYKQPSADAKKSGGH